MVVKLLNCTIFVDQVLCKVPRDLGAGLFLEPFEKAVCIVADAFDLPDNWKLGFVICFNPIFDLFFRVGFLLPELVAWESNDLETKFVVCLVHLDILFVVGVRLSLAGYIDDNRGFCILCKKIHCTFSSPGE